MSNGKIGVSTRDLFPIIKKFLYSDHDIFLREIVSNAVDATQKLKLLAQKGETSADLKVTVKVDKDNKTITVSDSGIGMTQEEVEKYINQIAFSGAEEFLEKHKDDAAQIIGHFGMGFYSSFMVSDKVEIETLSYKEGSKAVHWACTGEPEYTLEECEKTTRGTDIIMHISEEEKDFLEENKVEELLNKYCKFLPIEIVFKDKTINDTNPAWTRKPADLKDEDYANFYRQLYPMQEEPLFNIHLNVDYPFNLTGILYFPKIRTGVDINRNKVQLYCNQVFVTDSVEGIVPDFLTLLHGVIDSPDIPLNVSRSYLQSDSNVKKISTHITKKVSDRLEELFKNDRANYESKWDDLKIFIEYGILTEEKFAERATKFQLLKNVDGKYFTWDEYRKLIEGAQTDKDGNVTYIYCNDATAQYQFVQGAKNKGYDVLIFDGQLDTPVIQHLESKNEKTKFIRVDAEVADKLIPKEDAKQLSLSKNEQSELEEVFRSQMPKDDKTMYNVSVEALAETDLPVIITQSEWMRRMKEMAQVQGGMMAFYGQMPDSFNVVVNANHKHVATILEKLKSESDKLAPIYSNIEANRKELDDLNKQKEGKKEEEVPQDVKDKITENNKKFDELNAEKNAILATFATDEKTISQLIDLALLSNNMLKGEALTKFVARSIELL